MRSAYPRHHDLLSFGIFRLNSTPDSTCLLSVSTSAQLYKFKKAQRILTIDSMDMKLYSNHFDEQQNIQTKIAFNFFFYLKLLIQSNNDFSFHLIFINTFKNPNDWLYRKLSKADKKNQSISHSKTWIIFGYEHYSVLGVVNWQNITQQYRRYHHSMNVTFFKGNSKKKKLSTRFGFCCGKSLRTHATSKK